MSVLELLRAHVRERPTALALLAPGQPSITYQQLEARVEATVGALRATGVARGDRVAIVLPNGLDLAVALLGVLADGVAAPLGPDHSEVRFEHELTTLAVRAVVAPTGGSSAAATVARARGIGLLELSPDGALERTSPLPDALPVAAMADPTLLLATSGTTSTPKLVPLRADQVVRSAANVAETLRLTPDDRCLNVMPLFHIHGIVAALFASLHAGGSVICTPGFRAPDVVSWVEAMKPTWYTAVPTIHQAMLDVARAEPAGGSLRSSFRFVRSSSAALPRRVSEELEAVFAAPVVEAYGMTEAAHQMASNLLPPGRRKVGTVGVPAGAEITVLDEKGEHVPAGGTGEIAIRGASVTHGYLDNPDAAAIAFQDGWFRTGDQGRFDEDGHLVLTGRLKEIINRGGENIAPREVDDALLAHEDVVHAVAFAAPHPRLGEEVSAAVVLRHGATVTAAQLRVFVRDQLTPSHVPRRVLVVDELPRTATGKLDRRRLPEQLGLLGDDADDAPAVPPRDELEREVAELWQRVLGLDELPSVEADFFDLGGDSLHATELLEVIDATFGRVLPAPIFFTGATVRGMADAVRTPEDEGDDLTVVAVQTNGTKPPLFCMFRGGSVVAVRHFVTALGADQPVYGLFMPSLHGRIAATMSMEEIAQLCLKAIREVQPSGPYFFVGHSLAAHVLYEASTQLTRDGETVGFLGLIDVCHPERQHAVWRRDQRRKSTRRVRRLFSTRGPKAIARRVRLVFRPPPPKPASYVPGSAEIADWGAAEALERSYRPGPATWPVSFFVASRLRQWSGDDLGYGDLLRAEWHVDLVPGNHDTIIGEPYVHVLAAKLKDRLVAAQRAAGS